jgi:hypothetical protein
VTWRGRGRRKREREREREGERERDREREREREREKREVCTWSPVCPGCLSGASCREVLKTLFE